MLRNVQRVAFQHQVNAMHMVSEVLDFTIVIKVSGQNIIKTAPKTCNGVGSSENTFGNVYSGNVPEQQHCHAVAIVHFDWCRWLQQSSGAAAAQSSVSGCSAWLTKGRPTCRLQRWPQLTATQGWLPLPAQLRSCSSSCPWLCSSGMPCRAWPMTGKALLNRDGKVRKRQICALWKV